MNSENLASAKIKSVANNISNYISTNVSKGNIVKYFLITLIIFLIVMIIVYIVNKLNYQSTKCSNLEILYERPANLKNVNLDDPEINDKCLYDFYIKTAYNACALGDFKNTYVNTCALKAVIKQGVRCLDFEIYDVNNTPVVSVSVNNDYNFKQSFNSVAFSEVLDVINNYAFSNATCPTFNDLLLLHLRIKTNNISTINLIADTILNKIGNKLLDKRYSYECEGDNLGKVPIKTLLTKNNTITPSIIIIVDKSNPNIENSKLDEYVNIASTSRFMRQLRDYDVKNTPNFEELKDYNKRNMTISFPDLTAQDNNVSFNSQKEYGIQLVGMCYQNYDPNLQFYENFFSSYRSAFVLKPEHLRYVEVTVPAPVPQNPKLSYATKDISADFYNFKI